jgi:integrase
MGRRGERRVGEGKVVMALPSEEALEVVLGEATNRIGSGCSSGAGPLPSTGPGIAVAEGVTMIVAPVEGEVGDGARAYAAAGVAENTRRTYSSAWRAFSRWCSAAGRSALPADPATVADYLADLAERGRKPAGLDVVLVAIGQAHKAAGVDSPRSHPLVLRVRRGIRRTVGTAQRRAAPLLLDELRAAIAACPADTFEGDRDRALLLVGWAAALRRSELVGLDLGDVREVADGVEVTLRRRKTDQEGEGTVIPVPFGSHLETCPVRALRSWLTRRGEAPGRLFLSVRLRPLDGREVDRVVKRRAGPTYSAHALRAGFATAAARAGKSTREIRRQTGHASDAMVERYIREADRWRDCPAAGLGL